MDIDAIMNKAMEDLGYDRNKCAECRKAHPTIDCSCGLTRYCDRLCQLKDRRGEHARFHEKCENCEVIKNSPLVRTTCCARKICNECSEKWRNTQDVAGLKRTTICCGSLVSKPISDEIKEATRLMRSDDTYITGFLHFLTSTYTELQKPEYSLVRNSEAKKNYEKNALDVIKEFKSNNIHSYLQFKKIPQLSFYLDYFENSKSGKSTKRSKKIKKSRLKSRKRSRRKSRSRK